MNLRKKLWEELRPLCTHCGGVVELRGEAGSSGAWRLSHATCRPSGEVLLV